MLTEEKLKQDYEEKLAELKNAQALLPLLPKAPEYLHFTTRKEPWVSYKVRGIAEAVALLAKFDPLPIVKVRETFLHIQPEVLLDPSLWGHPSKTPQYGVTLVIDQYSSPKLIFWHRLNEEKIARVSIEVTGFFFSLLTLKVIRTGFNGDIVEALWKPISKSMDTSKYHFAEIIQWSTGGYDGGKTQPRATALWSSKEDFEQFLSCVTPTEAAHDCL